jgi:hypothetical protein
MIMRRWKAGARSWRVTAACIRRLACSIEGAELRHGRASLTRRWKAGAGSQGVTAACIRPLRRPDRAAEPGTRRAPGPRHTPNRAGPPVTPALEPQRPSTHALASSA